jgi:hypothetical protein
MDYLKIFYGSIMIFIAQTLVWFQVYGPLKIDFLKNNSKWFPYIMAIPISYIFIKSIELVVDGFGGSMWPSRFINFSLGAISFAFLTSFYNNENIDLKTSICLILSVIIILIQFFWKN